MIFINRRAFILCVKVVQLVVMMMDDYKSSDNFNGVEGYNMISPHHFHPSNGGSSDSNF